MATIKFLYRSTKDKAFLTLQFFHRHNEKNFKLESKTEIEVSKYYWENEHLNTDYKKTYNIDDATALKALKDKKELVKSQLAEIESEILKAFYAVTPENANKEWLQTQINYYYNPPKEAAELPTELLKYFDYFMEQKKTEVTNGTFKKYNVTKSLLSRYLNTLHNPIFINDVNEKFKKDFEKYCLNQNYALNTFSKDLRVIKTVCNHAKHNGIKTSHQLDSIKTPQHKTDKIYLTFEDLEKIENIDKRRLNDNTENAKDWLIISCYTGQRVSDFMRFDKSMIRQEKNRKGELKPFIEFTQVKTGKIMVVALHPKVIEILDKRNGNFPKSISDPKYNLFIKEVCRIAGLNEIIKGSKIAELETKIKSDSKQFRKEAGMFNKWELITSHIGRRSFCTNFYGTIPTTYLMNVSGHSSEQTFLIYIGKSNKDLAMEITNYF